MIGRLDPQKGFDLVAGAAPGCSSAARGSSSSGSGHPELADPFRALAAGHPRQVALLERFDRVMARRIYAGSDFFLMPSRFEPCGQGQMIALRYGTPPIVHRTGGLADTVVDVTAHPGRAPASSSTRPAVGACWRPAMRRSGRHAAGGAPWAALRDAGWPSTSTG